MVSKGLSKNARDGKYGNVTYARSSCSTWPSATKSIAVFNFSELHSGSSFGTGGGFVMGGDFFGLDSGAAFNNGGAVEGLVGCFLAEVDLAASRAFRSCDRNCANLQ